MPGGYIPRLESKERECWKFLDWQLNSENYSRLHGQPSIFYELFLFLVLALQIMGLSINDSVYSCLFFFLTGLHFFHLLVGLLLCSLLFCTFLFLGITIILQIITGIFLGLHYTSDLNSAYSSLFFFIREIFYGWCLRYLHSSGASFVFLFLFLHLGRAISYGSYFYNPNTWFSGIILFFFLMATAFMGYVLPFGQMSFWGATVITNLLSPFPSLIEWVSGGHYVYNPTLKRFFLFHFLFPFLLCGFRILHLFYLHFLSSNNPLRNSINNKIPFFPFIFQKDFFGFILILCLYLLQTHFGISSFSHPDNALEVCGLLTPLHIVPEWYFLCQYAMLKAVPNKNAGFIILLTSIFTFFFFGEIRNLTTFCLLNNNGFSLSSFFLSSLSFLWIGAQFPQEKFLSYGRILTLHYYFLIICILFSMIFSFLDLQVY